MTRFFPVGTTYGVFVLPEVGVNCENIVGAVPLAPALNLTKYAEIYRGPANDAA